MYKIIAVDSIRVGEGMFDRRGESSTPQLLRVMLSSVAFNFINIWRYR